MVFTFYEKTQELFLNDFDPNSIIFQGIDHIKISSEEFKAI